MMKADLNSKPPVSNLGNGPALRLAGRSLLAATLAWCVAAGPEARTQDPFAPQPPALIGPTPGASLRNAGAATLTQAGIVRNAANAWGRRANSGTYRAEHFQQDYSYVLSQYQALRIQFNWLASLMAQQGAARTQNAVAELDAGLNVIAELFSFLEGQYAAGTLDRNTIVRTTRAFEDAMKEWERELRKNNSRLGLVW
jgi:hypothetical protein